MGTFICPMLTTSTAIHSTRWRRRRCVPTYLASTYALCTQHYTFTYLLHRFPPVGIYFHPVICLCVHIMLISCWAHSPYRHIAIEFSPTFITRRPISAYIKSRIPCIRIKCHYHFSFRQWVANSIFIFSQISNSYASSPNKWPVN